MNKAVFLIFAVFMAMSACKSLQQARSNPETAIPVMIKMLEAENYTDFFNTFVNPEDLKNMTSKYPLDNLIEGFVKNGKAEKLLNTLKAAEKVSPIYEENKTLAKYNKELTGMNKDLILVKVNNLWYIAN